MVTVAVPSFKVEGLSVGIARCDNDDQLAIESSFVRALTEASLIEVTDGGRLVLTGPGGQLVFQQARG